MKKILIGGSIAFVFIAGGIAGYLITRTSTAPKIKNTQSNDSSHSTASPADQSITPAASNIPAGFNINGHWPTLTITNSSKIGLDGCTPTIFDSQYRGHLQNGVLEKDGYFSSDSTLMFPPAVVSTSTIDLSRFKKMDGTQLTQDNSSKVLFIECSANQQAEFDISPVLKP